MMCGCAPRKSWIAYANYNRVVVGYDPWNPQDTDGVAQEYCSKLNNTRAVYAGNPTDPNNNRPFNANSYRAHYLCVP